MKMHKNISQDQVELGLINELVKRELKIPKSDPKG